MGKVFVALVIILFIGFTFYFWGAAQFQKNEEGTLGETTPEQVSIVTQNLEIPWETVFLPDGEILVTERPGRLTLIKNNGSTETVSDIEEVMHVGEGGLLGIALDPDFAENNFLYLYYTYNESGDNTSNRVVRYVFQDNSLKEGTILVDQIPGARNHNGGRLAFGPDGFLYITTGDAAQPSLAQDTDSLAGKILRISQNGEPAPDNPFGNEIYSYGHRNPQGLAWIDGQLWPPNTGQIIRMS